MAPLRGGVGDRGPVARAGEANRREHRSPTPRAAPRAPRNRRRFGPAGRIQGHRGAADPQRLGEGPRAALVGRAVDRRLAHGHAERVAVDAADIRSARAGRYVDPESDAGFGLRELEARALLVHASGPGMGLVAPRPGPVVSGPGPAASGPGPVVSGPGPVASGPGLVGSRPGRVGSGPARVGSGPG